MPRPAIQFYQLLSTPLERALPKLMEKACEQGMRAVIHGTEAQIETLDKALWNYNPDTFLPHGTRNDPSPERQPVYLCSRGENPNGATLRVIAHGVTVSADEPYERVFDLFDGTDETALAAARQRWKSYLDAGFSLTYIRQKENGGWEKLKETGQPDPLTI